MWSRVMFRMAATFGRKDSMDSSWKLDTSVTRTVSRVSSCVERTPSEKARPMLPETTALTPALATICPVRIVVVVLPFVPVMATIGEREK